MLAVWKDLFELPLRKACLEHVLHDAVVAASVAAVISCHSGESRYDLLEEVEKVKSFATDAMQLERKTSVHEVKKSLANAANESWPRRFRSSMLGGVPWPTIRMICQNVLRRR